MMEAMSREELYVHHKRYFEVLDELGKGIMIKPHLEQYMAKFNGLNKYKFNRDLDKLHKAKLIEIMKTKSVTIISLTSPSLMFIRNKKSVKEVSTSSVTTNRNLKMSMVKNEYITTRYLANFKTFEELQQALKQTMLVNKTGDNAEVLKALLKNHLTIAKSSSMISSLEEEIAYIEASKSNKVTQMGKGNKEKQETNFNKVSTNNLQARHIYFTSFGKFEKIEHVGDRATEYKAPITFVYMEVTDLIGFQKLKRDMDMLSTWLTSNANYSKVTINVVIEPNRRGAIEDTIGQWHRKRLDQFCTRNVVFNIVEIDVTTKHLKGLNIAI